MRAEATSLVRETRAKVGDLKGKAPYSIVRLRVLVKKNISQNNLAGASMRHRIANALVELLSSSLMMEIIARQSSYHPRRAFHSISHSARVWFLGGLVFCRIAVAVVVVCVEPRGPVIDHVRFLDPADRRDPRAPI